MRVSNVMTVSLAGCVLLGAAAAAPSQELTDPAVDSAIRRGAKFLWSKQDKQTGSWPALNQYKVGPSALACYALLESGVNPQDPRMAKALAWLSRQKTTKTYSLACLCNVWLAANRSTRDKYRKFLYRDAKQLWLSATRGGYDYESDRHLKMRFDNSNSQFGLLGVWAAAMNFVEVPRQYWLSTLSHWKETQYPNGTWDYQYDPKKKSGKPTMTVGGIASLFVCSDELYARQFLLCRGGQYAREIQLGLDWMGANLAATMRGGPDYYYYYGVERVALASGYKYFGQADWYKLGRGNLLRAQQGHGGWPAVWGSDLASTSLALLFLIRGRNAVLFNKLEYDGFWNNRPRDLAMLTRWMSRIFERTVNWQIINLQTPVSEWHDAPLLYIAGSKKPQFSDADLAKLRTFVQQGGAIFSVGECEQVAFGEGMREAYKKLFPAYALSPCEAGHEIYTRKVHFDVPAGQPKLYILSNGVRPLAVHTDEDLSRDWQLRLWTSKEPTFKIAANIARYVTGRVSSLRHRGTSHWPAEAKYTPKGTFRVARLHHSGNWDPEPLAYVRLARLLAEETAVKLEVVSPVSIEHLDAATTPLATLTGTGRLALTSAQTAGLRKYVQDGGTLLIDAAGGEETFDTSARQMLRQLLPKRHLRPLSTGCALYNEGGKPLGKVLYRFRTDLRLGRIRTPNLYALTIDGRPAVLYSREDITAALVGYSSLTVDGYRPASAYQIMRNLVLSLGFPPRKPENPSNLRPGLLYSSYEGTWDRLPDFKTLKASFTGVREKFELGPKAGQDHFAVRLTGYLDVPRDGTYAFFVLSDDGSKLYIGDRQVVDNDGLHKATEKEGGLKLEAGKHAVTVLYFDKDSDEALRVGWQGPGIAKQEIPPAALFHVKP